jgi:hypothetical protein
MYGIYENGQIIAKFAAPLTLVSNMPVFASDTLSLKRRIQKRGVQRWELSSGVEPLSDSANDLFVNLVTKGVSETLTITTPQNYGVIRRRTHSAGQTAQGTALSTQITIANSTGFMPKGTMIRFGNHSKIYMTTSDRENNGTVNIFPPLRINVPVGTSVSSHDEVLMSVRYEMDTITGMAYRDGILMDMGVLKFVEDV